LFFPHLFLCHRTFPYLVTPSTVACPHLVSDFPMLLLMPVLVTVITNGCLLFIFCRIRNM
jgi:hypothetical protein